MWTAFDAHDMGLVMRAFRTHPRHGRDIPQEVAAGWLGVTQSTLSRIERGSHAFTEAKLLHWADVLGVPEHLRWFSSPLATTQPSNRLPVVASERHAPMSLGSTQLGQPSHATTSTNVAAIKAMASAFQTADRQTGGGQLYTSVLNYLRTDVSARLFDPADGDMASQVFAAAASLTEIAGWMAHDGGQDQYARHHFGQAYRLANAAEHPALAGNICASMSHLAGQLGEPTNAVHLADVGLQHAHRYGSSARLTARLHAMRARGLAMTGNTEDCVAALDEAERTLGDVDRDVPSPWISHFDEASLASEAALCLRQLGELDAAERQARRVVELRVGDRVRSRAFGQITLARVLLDTRQIEAAATLGREVCVAAQSLASARVVARLTLLADALRPHTALPAVSAFLADCAGLKTQGTAQDAESVWPV